MTAGVASRQWIRRLTCAVNGQAIVLDNMQAYFQVRQYAVETPPYCFIRIFNLSDRTSDAIFQENASVRLEGGYPGRFGLMFDGNAQQMRRGKLPNGVDRYHDIVATSGREAYGFATVQESLDAGSTMRDVADKAIQSMQQHGVQPGSISESLAQRAMPRPVTLYGMSRDILRMVAESTNTAWHIVNNQLNIVDNGGYLPGATIELNGSTGLIGLPEQTFRGVVAKMLLNPDARPEQRVHIDSRLIQQEFAAQGFFGGLAPHQAKLPKIAVDGMYKILRVDHDGEVEGQEFYTTLVLAALDDKTSGVEGLPGNQSLATIRGLPEVQQGGQGAGGQ